MEAWRKTWRDGAAPLLSTASLEALRKALVNDDPALIQGATTDPPPLQWVQDWPCERACLIAYAGWQGDDLKTVNEVEEFFARMSFEMDQRLGEPAACRYLYNWWDDTPRADVRQEMIAEVQRSLAERLREEPEEVVQ